MSSPGPSTTTSSHGVRLQLGASGTGFDSAFADRVRLYLKATFLINVFFTVAILIVFLTGGDWIPGGDSKTVVLAALALTAFNGMVWFFTVRTRPTFLRCIFAAASVTLVLSWIYTHVAMNNGYPNDGASALFALLAVSMILVLRAALIPTPAVATAIIGLICLACPLWVARPESSGEGWVFLSWACLIGLTFVGITTVASHTIYGVERRMFAATKLGQYQLDRIVGRGAMGEVYLARHALLHRPTAIKLLRNASASSARNQFRHEVQTASGLTHPNTVEIYDYGRTPDGVFYFAMEYVEGATLEDIVASTGPMPAARAIHLLAQAAGSLGEAHSRGLIHRDVKPSNLMLCERGGVFDTLKVLDFGLVRNLSEPTDSVGLTGTPLFLAPEAIVEADGAVPQSDVYALGATAYYLLTGRPPFDHANLVEVLADHLATEPAAIDCGNPGLSALVLRCLAKDPLGRPTDAAAFARELETCVDFGTWRAADADVWWAEHRAVVAARQSMMESALKGRMDTSRSSSSVA